MSKKVCTEYAIGQHYLLSSFFANEMEKMLAPRQQIEATMEDMAIRTQNQPTSNQDPEEILIQILNG